ncbi:MAG: prolyl aminopeptidase [Azospirillum sp.]|nr:prolyl aminopeptidase [Azospirillum sp.]
MPRSELFPPIEPFKHGMLRVDDLHTLYWEQSGNPGGVPILFIHGGPGAGASPTHRRFFDPTHYRIVIVDQRGAGRSTPLGEIRRNTTELLISDFERLREFLGIPRWHLFGGSWGSTLALAYAQSHPDRILGLILRGIFLMRQSEIDWFLHSMRTVYPEAAQQFLEFLEPQERDDPLESYWRRLTSPDPGLRMSAARAWSIYEGACSSLLPNPDLIAAAGEDTHALGLARIEAHYFRNNKFQPESQLLDQIDRIRNIPATIIQGRYDIICPIVTADALHRRWPEADYRVVPDAGHSAMEPGIRAALVGATERYKALR